MSTPKKPLDTPPISIIDSDDDLILVDDAESGEASDDDTLHFWTGAHEQVSAQPETPSVCQWRVLVVDDEPAVHTVTRLALEGFEVEGVTVRLQHAHSAAEARELLQNHPDTALVLLDVMMETDSAGLDLARWIRAELGNAHVRIVLRTGQAGMAPEERVMATYDIHDYYAKTEASANRIRNTVTGGLRAWRDLRALAAHRDELERAQHLIVRSLHEKDALLKEIHHRVKNNLQIISSLLQLQGERMPTDEARALIQETVMRVRSMALIHQHVYCVESLDQIDFGDYIRVLAESVRGLLAPTVRLRVESADVRVGLDDAIPAGLVLNELITNAFKYGLPAPAGSQQTPSPRRTGEDCDLQINVNTNDGLLEIEVIDSGPGLPDGALNRKSSSLGLSLVRALTKQIRGELTYDYDNGSRFAFSFTPRPLVSGEPAP